MSHRVFSYEICDIGYNLSVIISLLDSGYVISYIGYDQSCVVMSQKVLVMRCGYKICDGSS